MKKIIVKVLITTLVLGVVSACSKSAVKVPIITMSKPKVYLDDQVHRITADRLSKIAELGKNIKETGVQESFGVQQATQFSGSLAVYPVGTDAPAAAEKKAIVLPAAPTGDVGRTAPDLLRAQINTDQDIMGYELLYLGDAGLKNTNSKIALIRFDVSINRYFTSTKLSKFAVMHCAIKEEGSYAKVSDDGIYVYTLAPEFSSIVAKESLASSTLTDLAAQVAGVAYGANVQAGANLQRALQESMLTMLEYPVQFALYGEKQNEFLFAFGPRRRLDKLNWFFRNICLMDPYQVEYVISPGARDCYALVVMPKKVKRLGISVWVADDFSTFEPGAFQNGTATPSTAKNVSGSQFVEKTLKLEESLSVETDKQFKNQETPEKQPTYYHTVEVPNCSSSASGSTGLVVTPQFLYPEITNTLLVTTNSVLSPEVTVLIESVPIPAAKVKILGRSHLIVTVEPDDQIKNMLSSGITELDVKIVSPDQPIESTKLKLKKGTKTPATPKAVFKPSVVEGRQRVALIRNDKNFNFEKIKSITISSFPPITEFHSKAVDKIEFSVPKKDSENKVSLGVPLTVDIEFEDGFEPHKLSLPEALRYK